MAKLDRERLACFASGAEIDRRARSRRNSHVRAAVDVLQYAEASLREQAAGGVVRQPDRVGRHATALCQIMCKGTALVVAQVRRHGHPSTVAHETRPDRDADTNTMSLFANGA